MFIGSLVGPRVCCRWLENPCVLKNHALNLVGTWCWSEIIFGTIPKFNRHFYPNYTLMFWRDLFYLAFPNLCPACEKPLPQKASFICSYCFETLPKTAFHGQKENAATNLFRGRYPFDRVTSALYFSKDGSVQKILHSIKYKGNTNLAESLGEWYGKVLFLENTLANAPCFVPVPLHEKKLYQRGYNQALYWAKGLSKGYEGSFVYPALQRNLPTETQTKKGRYDRWKNVEHVFEVLPDFRPENKHIVLVDDVLTTGATLESCARALQRAGANQVSVVTLAYAGG